MTPEERQALREKHGKFGFRENRTFCVFCLDDDGLDIPYPCDVIKVLDEVDRVMNAAEGYGVVVRAMVEQNSNETITELAKSDQNRNLNSTISAQTDPYGPQPDQERKVYVYPSERRVMSEKHQPHATFPSQCDECSNTWPCDASRLLDQLNAIADGLTCWLQDIKLHPEVTIDLILNILDGEV